MVVKDGDESHGISIRKKSHPKNKSKEWEGWKKQLFRANNEIN